MYSEKENFSIGSETIEPDQDDISFLITVYRQDSNIVTVSQLENTFPFLRIYGLT